MTRRKSFRYKNKRNKSSRCSDCNYKVYSICEIRREGS
ncbi:MAG: hypothetical protein K1V96_03060 [Lachnospiraceae bacterium]